MKIAVVGATGLVGRIILQLLEERDFPVDDLIPVASKNSIGESITFKGKDYSVVSVEEAVKLIPDIALFSAGRSISLEWAPKFAAAGITVIDNSSAWRMDPGKKLVVPEVNGDALEQSDKIIANPNCSTIQMVLVLKPLHEKYEPLIAQAAPGSPELAALNKEYQSARLTHSYAGMLGHTIEPVIRPLGFDWKIGIALITSFAAREVFVGTMATLYSVGENPENNNATLREKLSSATWPDGAPVYTLASGLSLMIFYAFAMQCMSTMAIVKRETKSWKFPLIQLTYMTGLAYICSFIEFHIFR